MEIASVFKAGPFQPQRAPSPSSVHPPKPLLVFYPSHAGEYPILIFFHGFALANDDYTKIFQHIASHGYIIVAPQMYDMPMAALSGDATQEVADTVALTAWLPTWLSCYLADGVRPDYKKVVVAGHSRGGKVAFGAALGRSPTTPSSCVKYSAIIGVDPVDGRDSNHQIPPPILSNKEHSLRQGVPVLIIGSGTPHQLMSPDGVNHRNFFKECCHPAYHFVAKTCGHLDFADDTFKIDVMSIFSCQKGEAREGIWRFSGGMMVAFLKGCVQNDYSILKGIMEDPSVVPVEIEPPEEKHNAALL